MTCCGRCGHLKGGNEAGALCRGRNLPPVGERQAAWERGDWDASCYCIDCFMRYYDSLGSCDGLL